MGAFDHDPDAELDYGFDWTDWLNGNSVSDSAWAFGDGLEQVDTIATVGGIVGVVVKAKETAELNKTYELKNTITDSEGRIDVRRHYLTIKQR